MSESAAVGKAGSRIRVVVEVAQKRSFASAIDWPGWCRSGRTPDAALEGLAAYAGRYRPVAVSAGLRLPAVKGIESFEVIEEVKGDATTDFGAPGTAACSWRARNDRDSSAGGEVCPAVGGVNDGVPGGGEGSRDRYNDKPA